MNRDFPGQGVNNYSSDLKSEHSKSGLFEGWILNGSVLKGRDIAIVIVIRGLSPMICTLFYCYQLYVLLY